MVYPTISAVTPNRDKFGIDLSRGTDVNNYIILKVIIDMEQQLLGRIIANQTKMLQVYKT